MVWNDEQFFVEAERLVNDRDKMKHMDRKCAKIAKEWGWDQVALQWEIELHHTLSKV